MLCLASTKWNVDGVCASGDLDHQHHQGVDVTARYSDFARCIGGMRVFERVDDRLANEQTERAEACAVE